MNKLAAVNLILRAAGFLPVPALDTDGGSIAAEAERTLDERELEIQQMAWNYNHRFNITLSPDDAGHITMPTGCLWIDAYGSSSGWKVTALGEKLYDQDADTDVFTSDIIVEYRLRYEWGCIPLHVRQYIAADAAAEFNLLRGRQSFQARLELKRDNSRTRALQLDGDQQDVNTLDTNFARGIRGSRSGYVGGTGEEANYA